TSLLLYSRASGLRTFRNRYSTFSASVREGRGSPSAGTGISLTVVAGHHDFFTHVDIRRSEEHTSELQSPYDLVCRLLLEKNTKQRSLNYCAIWPRMQTKPSVDVDDRRALLVSGSAPVRDFPAADFKSSSPVNARDFPKPR